MHRNDAALSCMHLEEHSPSPKTRMVIDVLFWSIPPSFEVPTVEVIRLYRPTSHIRNLCGEEVRGGFRRHTELLLLEAVFEFRRNVA
jgi:hypothetical protein